MPERLVQLRAVDRAQTQTAMAPAYVDGLESVAIDDGNEAHRAPAATQRNTQRGERGDAGEQLQGRNGAEGIEGGHARSSASQGSTTGGAVRRPSSPTARRVRSLDLPPTSLAENNTMQHTLTIRVLHLFLALGVPVQMTLAEMMRVPRPGRTVSTLEAWSFAAHEVVGMALLAALVAHWLVLLAGRARKGPGELFPWFSYEKRQRLAADVAALIRLARPQPGRYEQLAGAVQGAGLVIAALLALTGGALFFGMSPGAQLSASMRAVKEFHELLGPLMWGYLALHAGAALLHAVAGDTALFCIFRLNRAAPSDASARATQRSDD